ncbi:MAG: hypothetical protein U0136_03445 [Bdellovibrionota bacterium]
MRARVLGFIAAIGLFSASTVAAQDDDYFRSHCKSLSDTSVSCSGIDLKQFECDGLSFPSASLSSLAPQESVLICHRYGEKSGIFNTGCMLRDWIAYLVKRGENIVLIDSAAKFADHFGPVDAPEKAVAFLFALTPTFRGDAVKPPLALSSAEVQKGEDGFNVAAFNRQNCGCGTHPISEVVYHVTNAGAVSELSTKKVRDTTPVELCID